MQTWQGTSTVRPQWSSRPPPAPPSTTGGEGDPRDTSHSSGEDSTWDAGTSWDSSAGHDWYNNWNQNWNHGWNDWSKRWDSGTPGRSHDLPSASDADKLDEYYDEDYEFHLEASEERPPTSPSPDQTKRRPLDSRLTKNKIPVTPSTMNGYPKEILTRSRYPDIHLPKARYPETPLTKSRYSNRYLLRKRNPGTPLTETRYPETSFTRRKYLMMGRDREPPPPLRTQHPIGQPEDEGLLEMPSRRPAPPGSSSSRNQEAPVATAGGEADRAGVSVRTLGRPRYPEQVMLASSVYSTRRSGAAYHTIEVRTRTGWHSKTLALSLSFIPRSFISIAVLCLYSSRHGTGKILP